MKYKFPQIQHLDQVKEAIEGRDEFIIAEREFGFVVNYLVHLIDTFPRPNTKDEELNRLYTIRRECRGIKFDHDGKIIARPYHKFFNLGERPETEIANIDFDKTFVILDKLDGSMIHPMFFFHNTVAWCTKMGLTDVAVPAQKFAETHPDIDYVKFSEDVMTAGYTPIFEWCSRQQRIVVDYPDDQLILTAIRNMVSGEYSSVFEMEQFAKPYDVPIVGQWQGRFRNIQTFLDTAQSLEDEEGYVIRWPDGHMGKAKNEWYCQLHKVKELLQFEKDVWALVLDEKQDDAKAFMEQEDKDRIDNFAQDLYNGLNETADRLNWVVIAAKDNLNNSKKRFALEVALEINSLERGLMFKIWDGADPEELLREFVRAHVGSGPKLEEVRFLAGGIKWEDY